MANIFDLGCKGTHLALIWGTMIATTRRFLCSESWGPLVPCIAIFITALAFDLLGDGLRDMRVEIENLHIILASRAPGLLA